MLFINKTKTHLSLFYLLTFLILSSCNVYDTIRVESISNESLATLYKQQRTVVIHDNREKNEFLLTDFKIENDSLKGIIKPAPIEKTHEHHKESFKAKEVKAYNPLSVMHVYSRLSTIDIGHFEIPLSSIRFVEIHESNTRKSMSRTFIPIGIGALVVIAWVIIG
jgi:hypothetical protein